MGTILVTVLGLLVVWRRRLSADIFLKLEGVGGAAAIMGAKLWYMISTSIETGNWNISREAYMSSGLSFYGGMLLGLAGVWIASAVLRVDFHLYAENLIFLVPLLYGIWKIGCFMGGCCYGIPYSGPFAAVFPQGVRAPAGIPLFPVQLVEAGISFVMSVAFFVKGHFRKRSFMKSHFMKKHFTKIIFMKKLFRKELIVKEQGASWEHPVLEYILCYACLRFFAEFFRYHEVQAVISIAQAVSLACVSIVVLYYFFGEVKHFTQGA